MKKILLVMALALGVSGSAMAVEGPLSYDYVQGTVIHNHEGQPANGVDGKVSFDLASGVFVQADASRLQLHDVHADRYQAGLGYHIHVADGVSAYGLASAVSVDSNVSSVTPKYGFDGEVGLRVAVTPTWEVAGAVETEKLNLNTGATNQVKNYGKVSTSYFLSNDVAIVAEFRGSKVDHQVGAGVRWTW